MKLQAVFIQDQMVKLCQQWNVTRLAVFGSAVRRDFHDESDVDLLVRFAPERTPGWEIVDLEEALASIFGRKVDLVTEEDLHPRIRARAVQEQEVIYEEDGQPRPHLSPAHA